jgi:RNA polymerase sigma factor (sigma-70 family)
LSDQQLLARFAAREDMASAVAFEALVRRHGPMVLATCRGALRDEHDAEEAFQATFFVLARKADTLRRGDRLGPWLHRVALRTSEQARVATAQRRQRELQAAERAALVEHEPGWHVEREEVRRAVHQELDRLPERYRAVVLLCDLQGESYESAAAQLRVPLGTVRSRLSRARERLRGGIERRGLALSASVAVVLTSRKASAALPSNLVASTVNLATMSAAGRLGVGTVSLSTTAAGYAKEVLKARALLGVTRAAAAMAVAGVGLTGIVLAMLAFQGDGQAMPGPVVGPAQVPAAGAVTFQTSVANDRARRRREAEKLQGRWQISEAAQFGAPLNLVVGDHLVIEGDRFIWTAARGEPQRIFRRGTTRGKIAIDMDADDQRIVLIESSWELPAGPPPLFDALDPPQIHSVQSGRVLPALYRLEGDGGRLRLCVGDPSRAEGPRAFESIPGSQQLLIVLGREGS